MVNEESKGGTDNLIMGLPVFGNRIHGYRNSKRMAVNGMVKRLCKEEEVGSYVDLCDSFVGKEEMYARVYIIGITESWANNDITDAEFGLRGYVMLRKDRIGRRGGGVLLYIKETIPA